ncbi:MAG TPA: hypothetical protein VJB14_08635 [Planctomycetota bacterium]|nr:hypothetical protein [Planctomycetota bacterium]
MHSIASGFLLIPLGLGIASVLLWGVSLLSRRPPAPGPEVVAHALNGMFVLLLVGVWINFIPQMLSKKAPYDLEREVSLALLAGVSVATGAIQLGVRVELRRIGSTGQGTRAATMARRLTLFFSLMTLAVGGLLACRTFPTTPALVTMAAFSAVWIPSAILWRVAPEAGPIAPRLSAAARGSFFIMAVGAIVAATSPWLLASPVRTGFLAGFGASVVLLTATAWLAVVTPPRTAILLVGLAGGTAGFFILQSL